MKKLILLLSFFLMAITSIPAQAASTMSDRQVLEYVKKGMASGKSQKVILTELAARGVDRAQAERVKKLYQAEMSSKGENPANSSGVNRQRARRINTGEIRNGHIVPTSTLEDQDEDALLRRMISGTVPLIIPSTSTDRTSRLLSVFSR